MNVTDPMGDVLERIAAGQNPYLGIRGQTGGARRRMVERMDSIGLIHRHFDQHYRWVLTQPGQEALEIYAARQELRRKRWTSAPTQEGQSE